MELVKLDSKELRSLEHHTANDIQSFRLRQAMGESLTSAELMECAEKAGLLLSIRRDITDVSNNPSWLVG